MATRNIINAQSLVEVRAPGVLGYAPSFDRMSKMYQNRSQNQAALIWIGSLPAAANGLATDATIPLSPTAAEVEGSANPAEWSPEQVAHSLAWVQNWGLKLAADAILQLPYGVSQAVYWTGPNGGSNPAIIVGWS